MKHKRGFWLLMLAGWCFASQLSAAELAGSLAWGERISMGSLVSGVVAKVPVQAGQRVKKGDLLVGLDVRGFQAEVNGARAESARARVLLEEARLEDERATELYDRTVLSEHERAKAVIGLREAEAEAGRAGARLTQARLAYERSQLKAPFDGRVVAVHVSAGQAVVNEYKAEPMVELAGDSRMLLRTHAELAVARQAKGAKPMVEVAGRQIAVDAVQIGFEPVDAAAPGPVYPVTAIFTRPGDLELRAGEPARLVW